jgi:hypothetical protein
VRSSSGTLGLTELSPDIGVYGHFAMAPGVLCMRGDALRSKLKCQQIARRSSLESTDARRCAAMESSYGFGDSVRFA